MAKAYVFYNPLAGNGSCGENIKDVEALISDEIVLFDMTQGYDSIFSKLDEDDYIVLCGGDGTLNRFVNETDGIGKGVLDNDRYENGDNPLVKRAVTDKCVFDFQK
jgi:diacylglycerol kinase family enzyme